VDLHITTSELGLESNAHLDFGDSCWSHRWLK